MTQSEIYHLLRQDQATIYQHLRPLAQLIPGLDQLYGCQPADNDHLEGDVAIHTAMTVVNMTEVSRRRLGRDADLADLLAALIHDLGKPQSRCFNMHGQVCFPAHEKRSATAIPALAKTFELTVHEQERIHFAVLFHSLAHDFPRLNQEKKDFLTGHPLIQDLALLQEADALACIKPGGSRSAVYWQQLMAEANQDNN